MMTASSLELEKKASCSCEAACEPSKPTARRGLTRRALTLEYLTVGWNVLEGLIAVIAAVLAGSVALLGFGLDSFIECASAGVMIWRFQHERARQLDEEQLEAIERRALRLVAVSLALLAAYVAVDAIRTLWAGEHPRFSGPGVVLLVLSVTVMLWLARTKRSLASDLGSRALQADATQTTACWWLSVAALAGIGLNGLFGWWWADPVAALVIAVLIGREAREAWRGDHCC